MHLPEYMWNSENLQESVLIIWILGMEQKVSGLVASAFICWAISLAYSVS